MPSKVSLVALCTGFATTISLGGQTSRTSMESVLASGFGMGATQIAAIRRGDAVAVWLPGTLDREIVVSGAVRIQTPPERTVALVRDIERLESDPSFRQTTRISEPPRLEDFAGFSLTDQDLASLRRCRPRDCDVNLGPRGFAALSQVDWSAPNAPDHARALARQTALEYLLAYRSGGNQALAVYTDRERPLFVAQEFADMLKRTSQMQGVLPELSAYLLGHPAAPRPPGTEDFYYWSEADFGLKPVFRLNFVVIHLPSAAGGPRYAIATKQLYANHYFHTALEFRLVFDDEERPGRAHYLLVLNMARSDGLTGLFGGVVKTRVRNASRTAIHRSLTAMKRLAEDQQGY